MRNKLFFSLTLAGMAVASQAAMLTYGGTFSGLNESPPNASTGNGFALVMLDTTANMMHVDVQFQDLLSPVTVAHIHARPDSGTINGGVATQTPTFSGFPSGVTSGMYHAVFDMLLASSWNPAYITANGGTAASAWTAFQGKMANDLTYFNIHTSQFPGGEIRANLTLVPEPGTIAALGLGAVVLLRRRRKA